ncbi:hypothetical protein ON010_g13362 [Phytophthora cinnamomi]|nr:hypothetical protein ON010_g13362 [Phytophthora cinnamomi]
MRDIGYPEYFKSIYDCDIQAFSAFKLDRVVLIDEAQITYDDELLWLGYLKRTLDGGFPGMRFVLFSSYGSFDVYRECERAGTPTLIPPENTFGLSVTQSKPGLQLSRVELEEMVRHIIGALVCDLIWILCSGHIGIAQAMLRYLRDKFGSKSSGSSMLKMSRWNFGQWGYCNTFSPAIGVFQLLMLSTE